MPKCVDPVCILMYSNNNKTFTEEFMRKYTNSVGVFVPELLMPNDNVDLTKWAVVACDQYTSQPEYWEETDRMRAFRAGKKVPYLCRS